MATFCVVAVRAGARPSAANHERHADPTGGCAAGAADPRGSRPSSEEERTEGAGRASSARRELVVRALPCKGRSSPWPSAQTSRGRWTPAIPRRSRTRRSRASTGRQASWPATARGVGGGGLDRDERRSPHAIPPVSISRRAVLTKAVAVGHAVRDVRAPPRRRRGECRGWTEFGDSSDRDPSVVRDPLDGRREDGGERTGESRSRDGRRSGSRTDCPPSSVDHESSLAGLVALSSSRGGSRQRPPSCSARRAPVPSPPVGS